jgi:hypothetical protein
LITDGDTERTTLVDIAADNAATYWYKLKYPQLYKSTRYVQGHRVVVEIRDGSDGDEIDRRLSKYTGKLGLYGEKDQLD